jgi:nuclear receptor interaction protein
MSPWLLFLYSYVFIGCVLILQDVLIQCQRGISSISLNPVLPAQLAVGCADASVRIYDRRMLSTRLTGSSDPINSGKNVPCELSCDYRLTFIMNNDEFKEKQN